ncbi:hypothetical protein C4K13_2647 [Pseudomonas chlororaphis subsp. aureofaciens]|nr:hypothetical protein C4K13_2647 [Pseudomonas chlororaphis subsp. aureofaciens]
MELFRVIAMRLKKVSQPLFQRINTLRFKHIDERCETGLSLESFP